MDIATQELKQEFILPNGNGPLCGEISEDKELIVLSDSDGIFIFNKSGEQIAQLSKERAFAIALSIDAKQVALLTDTPAVELKTIEGELLCRLPLEGDLNSTLSGYSIQYKDENTLLVSYPSGLVEVSIENVVL